MRLAAAFALAVCAYGADDTALRKALTARTGVVTLPSGEFEISREIVLPGDAHDLEIKGANTTLKASPEFRGRALLTLVNGKNIRIHNLSLDGNRDAVGRMFSLPNPGTMYARFVPANGIVAENATGLEIADIKATHIAGFAVLVNSGKGVKLHDIDVTASGGFNAQRHNNGTGGIVIEEGTTDFEIRRCAFGSIRGNAVTLRSSDHGKIYENEFRSSPARPSKPKRSRPLPSRTTAWNRSVSPSKKWTDPALSACASTVSTAAQSPRTPAPKPCWAASRSTESATKSTPIT